MLLKRFIAIVIDTLILNFVVWLIFTAILDMQTVGFLIGFVGTLAYQAVLLPPNGQTPGKKIMGIRVRKLDGSPITMTTALIRAVGYFVNGIFLIGWIVAVITGRGFHDRMAGTEVVE
ncbi:MAG: RDD family protein [Anaerolineae bacterium]|nr:RDD family protein [Anaerolineae bacterium]